MKTTIGLFRGINVGGKSSLPMKELVTILKGLGFSKIRTYIQSGNVVFLSNKKGMSGLARTISSEIRKQRGFEPHVLLLGIDELEKAIAENPFPEAETDHKSLHLGFLSTMPEKPDLEALNRIKTGSERFELKDNVFYLHAPEGVGRSKLAANAERLLGVPMTSRNWRTVCKTRDMAKEMD